MRRSGVEQAKASVKKLFASLDARFRSAAGVPTGISSLDRAGGLQSGEIAVLAGHPGVGKTSMAVSIASHAAVVQDGTVLWISLAETAEQTAERLVLHQSHVQPLALRTGKPLMMARSVRGGTRSWLLIVLLAGCFNEPSELQPTCNEASGVRFAYSRSLAVGGTQTLELECYFTDGPEEVLFDLPANVSTDVDAKVSVDRTGSSVVVHGLQDGTAHLTLVSNDGSRSWGSTQFEVATIDHVVLQSGVDLVPPGLEVAYAREQFVDIDIALVASGGDEVFDQNMQVVAPIGAQSTNGGQSFDDRDMAEGAYTIQVTAGGSSFAAPFVLVDHADTIVPTASDLSISASGTQTTICFEALTASRFVANLAWTITLDGASTPDGDNCASVSVQNDLDHDGMIQISASAGGVSAQFVAPIL